MASWLVDVCVSPHSDQVLYAIPHAGAGVGATRPLLLEFGEHCSTTGVRLPGRESLLGLEPLTDIAALADELAVQIDEHADGRALSILGHCSGALLAFEVIERLAAGRVGTLFASAHPAPHRSSVEPVSHLPLPEFLVQVARDGYLPPEIVADEELVSLIEPALRADYAWTESHVPSEARLDCRIMALLGDGDDSMRRVDVQAWEESTTSTFALELVSGAHDLLREPAQLARVMRPHLT